MNHTTDRDALTGSIAARTLAENVMLHAAKKARGEDREPAKMLKILALLASPVYDPPNPEKAPVHLDLRAEWHVLRQGVRDSSAPILLARLCPPTLPALRAALSPRAKEQGVFPHVLHFSGHAWEEGLILEDELGQVHRAGTAEVIDALRDLPEKIDLVVLNGCESAAVARSVAQALLDGRLARAVVGHEKEVRDREAIAFAARLYAELCNGFSLKRALDNAEKEITTHKVIRKGDEELVIGKLSGGDPFIDERRPRGSYLTQANVFLGRGAELKKMAKVLASPTAVIILSGPPGIGKSSLLKEAALRNGWRFPGGMAYAAGPRPDESRPARAADLLAALADDLGLNGAKDLFQYTALAPTLLLLDNLDSLSDEEKVQLRESLRLLGEESAAILAIGPPSKILEGLPFVCPIILHQGLALAEAAEYALLQARQRDIRLTVEKARLISRSVDGHPLLVEHLVAQANRRDLVDLMEDVAKKKGDYAAMIMEYYSRNAACLDSAGEAAWRALQLFPESSVPQIVLQVAVGEEGLKKLRNISLADFDATEQLWRWHATVAEYSRCNWPLTEKERRAQRLALLPAWKEWLKRLPGGDQDIHSRLEESSYNLVSAVQDLEEVVQYCAGFSIQEACPEASAFLDKLEELLPLPQPTFILRDLIAKVCKVKLILLPAKENVQRPKLLMKMSLALFSLGRIKDAKEAAQKAEEIYREKAKINPKDFQREWASSLNCSCRPLCRLGQGEEALKAAKNATDIFRKEADANSEFKPALAGSLINLSNMLSEQGSSKEDALAKAQEAVDLFYSLVEVNPHEFEPDLAESLNTLGNRFHDLNKLEDALAAAQEAVDVFKKLAEYDPLHFGYKLAVTRNNLSDLLCDMEQYEGALDEVNKSIDIFSSLAEDNLQVILPDLATAIHNKADILTKMDRNEEALAAAQGSVNIRSILAESTPLVYKPEKARSLGVYGMALLALGQYNEAVGAISDGLKILVPFFRIEPKKFADRTKSLLQQYQEACRKAGLEPDRDLLSQFD